jgi:hypothetical protein
LENAVSAKGELIREKDDVDNAGGLAGIPLLGGRV